MQMSLATIREEIDHCDWFIFDQDDVRSYIEALSTQLDSEGINALFDDLFAFNAYLSRIEGYPLFEKIPYWEYSTCLEWLNTHMMVGDSFDLTLKNAKRFLGNIKEYYDYLKMEGSPTSTVEIEKALKIICGGKKLKLVNDIPYTENETYTELFKNGISIRFDMADYWLLILKTTRYEEKWTKLLEAAMKISKERVAKVKDLQARMEKAGYKGLDEITYNDVTVADANKAIAWFYQK